MGYDSRLASGNFANGLPWVMCPICFEANELLPALAGGMLATINGEVFDVCSDCNAVKWLYFANLMGA